MKAASDLAGQQYLQARYGPELAAIGQGMPLPRPFRLQFFDFEADRKLKVVRGAVHTRARSHLPHVRVCRPVLCARKLQATPHARMRTFIRRSSRRTTRLQRSRWSGRVRRTTHQISPSSSRPLKRSSCLVFLKSCWVFGWCGSFMTASMRRSPSTSTRRVLSLMAAPQTLVPSTSAI